jgi:hypothetical protein
VAFSTAEDETAAVKSDLIKVVHAALNPDYAHLDYRVTGRISAQGSRDAVSSLGLAARHR